MNLNGMQLQYFSSSCCFHKNKTHFPKQKIYIWFTYSFKRHVFSEIIFDGYSYPSHNPHQSFLLHVTFLKFLCKNLSFSKHANLPKNVMIYSRTFILWIPKDSSSRGVSLWCTRLNFHNMCYIISQITRKIRISFAVWKYATKACRKKFTWILIYG